MTDQEHLNTKAVLHVVALAAHLVYDHNQPDRLPRTKDGLRALHAKLHSVEQ